jgi:hypothetical protein
MELITIPDRRQRFRGICINVARSVRTIRAWRYCCKRTRGRPPSVGFPVAKAYATAATTRPRATDRCRPASGFTPVVFSLERGLKRLAESSLNPGQVAQEYSFTPAPLESLSLAWSVAARSEATTHVSIEECMLWVIHNLKNYRTARASTTESRTRTNYIIESRHGFLKRLSLIRSEFALNSVADGLLQQRLLLLNGGHRLVGWNRIQV